MSRDRPRASLLRDPPYCGRSWLVERGIFKIISRRNRTHRVRFQRAPAMVHYHLRQSTNSTPILSFTADRSDHRGQSLCRGSRCLSAAGNLEQTQSGNQYPASVAVTYTFERPAGIKTTRKSRETSLKESSNNWRWRLPRYRRCLPPICLPINDKGNA